MLTEPVPLFLGPVEIGVIALLLVLIFAGPQKIPELARSTGQATKEFVRGKKEGEQELEEVRNELNNQTETSQTDDGNSPADSQ